MVESRECPYCAERIEAEAQRCPSCRSVLVIGDVSRVAKRLELARVLSILLSIAGVLLPWLGGLLTRGRPIPIGALQWLGMGITIVGLGLLARLKGRSLFWGLLGSISCIGLLIVVMIEKRCFSCSNPVDRKRSSCPSCGAPV